MKTISVAISEDDYEAFRRSAHRKKRSIALLIREAMAHYRRTVLDEGAPLRELPLLTGHRPTGPLPSRFEIYDETFSNDNRSS